MLIYNFSSKARKGTNRLKVTVVCRNVPTLGPAERSGSIGLEEGVLLLNTEPGFQVLGLLHGLSGLDPGVVLFMKGGGKQLDTRGF